MQRDARKRTRDLELVESVELVEPTDLGGTASVRRSCSALAVTGAHSVLLVWSPTWLGAESRGEGAYPPLLLVSRMDSEPWAARRAHWMQLLHALGCAQPVLRDADEAYPEFAPWRGKPMGRMLCLPGAQGWQTCGRDGAPRLEFTAGPAGEVRWGVANEVAHAEPEPASAPSWLLPETRVVVPAGREAFQSAVFDGWPLSWRRLYAAEQGLPANAPLNSKVNLPNAVQSGAAMSEWICRALACRFSTWPLLRRRLAALARPMSIPGVRDEDVVCWWPRWCTPTLQTDFFKH